MDTQATGGSDLLNMLGQQNDVGHYPSPAGLTFLGMPAGDLDALRALVLAGEVVAFRLPTQDFIHLALSGRDLPAGATAVNWPSA